MDARGSMGATIDPAQLITQTDEDPIHFTQTQAVTPIACLRVDEEWCLVIYLYLRIAQVEIPLQSFNRAPV